MADGRLRDGEKKKEILIENQRVTTEMGAASVKSKTKTIVWLFALAEEMEPFRKIVTLPRSHFFVCCLSRERERVFQYKIKDLNSKYFSVAIIDDRWRDICYVKEIYSYFLCYYFKTFFYSQIKSNFLKLSRNKNKMSKNC